MKACSHPRLCAAHSRLQAYSPWRAVGIVVCARHWTRKQRDNPSPRSSNLIRKKSTFKMGEIIERLLHHRRNSPPTAEVQIGREATLHACPCHLCVGIQDQDQAPRQALPRHSLSLPSAVPIITHLIPFFWTSIGLPTFLQWGHSCPVPTWRVPPSGRSDKPVYGDTSGPAGPPMRGFSCCRPGCFLLL